MKHYQLILAAAFVAFAGCTNVEIEKLDETESNEIGFQAVTRKATRANNEIISGAAYGHDNTFQVWGWQTQLSGADKFTDVANDAASNFMTDLTISWTKGRDGQRDEAWRNATNYYYWPFTGMISFLAIHPSDVAPTTAKWNSTHKKPTATVDDYTVVGRDSTDLMFATAEGSRRADGLPLTFNHALSQIQFRVRTDYDYTQDTVEFKVDSVRIANIDLSGDVKFENGGISWSDNAAQTESKFYYETTQVVTYAATDAASANYGRALVMIPQAANIKAGELESTDPKYVEGDLTETTITIGYTMKQKTYATISGTVTVAAPWAKKAGSSTEAFAAWDAGKKYVYTLCFKLNEITFAPDVNNWVEVDVQTINVLD